MAEFNKTPNREILPYRETVACVIVDRKGRFPLVQKTNYNDDQYEFFGGGSERGENPETAAAREFEEEAGCSRNMIEVVGLSNAVINQYEWSESVTNQYLEKRGKAYKGQVQRYVFAKFKGRPEDINPKVDEIRKVIFVEENELPRYLIFPNQLERALKVVDEFRKVGHPAYGFINGVQSHVFQEEPQCKSTIIDEGGILKEVIELKHYQPPDNLIVSQIPRIFSSIEEAVKRPPLSVNTEIDSGRTSSEIMTEMLSGLDYFISTNHTAFHSVSFWKLYKDVSGPEKASEFYSMATYDLATKTLSQRIEQLKTATENNMWTGGFTGIVKALPLEVPEYPTESNIPQYLITNNSNLLFSPLTLTLLDLDTQYTQYPEKELEKAIETFRVNGISGWIAQTTKGHHFISDFLTPYEPNLWKAPAMLSLLISNLEEEYASLRPIIEQLYNADSHDEAKAVALEMLNVIPKKARTAVDLRHIAYRVISGMGVLRSFPSKGSEKVPHIVARIH